jgi:hypothetical protein
MVEFPENPMMRRRAAADARLYSCSLSVRPSLGHDRRLTLGSLQRQTSAVRARDQDMPVGPAILCGRVEFAEILAITETGRTTASSKSRIPELGTHYRVKLKIPERDRAARATDFAKDVAALAADVN